VDSEKRSGAPTRVHRRLLDIFPALLLVPEAPTPPTPAGAATDEAFYGFTEKPFSASTDPRFLYHSSAHDRAAQALLSAIRRRDGLFVLTGAPGVGKTTLCRAVIEELDRRTLTSLVLEPPASVEQLLRKILADFGLVSRDDGAGGGLEQASSLELVTKLRDFVAPLAQVQAFAVVIIDEAHTLPVATLDEICALVDADAPQRLLQIALVGQPSLLSLLSRGTSKRLAQRTPRAELNSLAPDEIYHYVMRRIAVAGPDARLAFDDLALERLYQLGSGVPERINRVVTQVLTLGHAASARTIDEGLVRAAGTALDGGGSELRQGQLRRRKVGFVLLALLSALYAAYLLREPLARAF
jgi:general secretion pathway protein A